MNLKSHTVLPYPQPGLAEGTGKAKRAGGDLTDYNTWKLFNYEVVLV